MRIIYTHLKIVLFICLFLFHSSAMAVDPLKPKFPSVPPAYETLSIGKQLAEARVNFSATNGVSVEETNGYTVTDPFGNTFVVDNIDDPTYAFYGNYVETSDNLTVFDTPEINSTVYVEEINFGNF